MTINVSKLHGMDIYTNKGIYVGKVGDVIIDTEKGEVTKLSLKPISNPKDAEEVLKSASVNFEDVLEIGDVIVVQRGPVVVKESPKAV